MIVRRGGYIRELRMTSGGCGAKPLMRRSSGSMKSPSAKTCTRHSPETLKGMRTVVKAPGCRATARRKRGAVNTTFVETSAYAGKPIRSTYTPRFLRPFGGHTVVVVFWSSQPSKYRPSVRLEKRGTPVGLQNELVSARVMSLAPPIWARSAYSSRTNGVSIELSSSVSNLPLALICRPYVVKESKGTGSWTM